MRRAIARRLTESKSTVPHFYLTTECVVDDLLALRRQVNEAASVKVSVNDFVIMAVMGGMRTFWGPLLGAAVFVVLQDYLSSITINWMSFIGLMFVLVVLFFPRGLLGVIGSKAQA